MAKIRTDFVTNSSSSSFIIGKKDDTSKTIESVYNYIRLLYFKHIEKSKEVFCAIKTHPYIDIKEWSNSKTLVISGKHSWESRSQIIKNFEEAYNIDFYDNFFDTCEWIECETYSDYENYWREKGKNKGCCDHAPFTICDFFENKEIYYPHENNTHLHRVDIYSSTLDWYYPSAEQAFKRITDSYYCEKCYRKKYCDEEECNATLDKFLYSRPREEDACLTLLGRIAILSESSSIPYSIVDSLKEISEFACNHMG